LAAIASVFTIAYVAKLLGEDEDWLHELSIDMVDREDPIEGTFGGIRSLIRPL
jgi:hypothetical protein